MLVDEGFAGFADVCEAGSEGDGPALVTRDMGSCRMRCRLVGSSTPDFSGV